MNDPFLQMYDDYFDDVYRYVYYKTGKKWDTDDLVSDIFRKAFEKFMLLKEHSNAKAWLFSIARNTVIDYYRRQKDTLSDTDMDLIEQPITFEEISGDRLDCLKTALFQLSQEDQEIINMKYFAEMKYREIGESLGKTEDAVKTRTFRLIKKIGAFVMLCLEEVKTNG